MFKLKSGKKKNSMLEEILEISQKNLEIVEDFKSNEKLSEYSYELMAKVDRLEKDNKKLTEKILKLKEENSTLKEQIANVSSTKTTKTKATKVKKTSKKVVKNK